MPLADWASFDPVLNTRFKINGNDRIATLGSCFAQHVARHLMESGIEYFRAEETLESTPKLKSDDFSAAYGNVYTVRQALQLLDRAFEGWNPGTFVLERNGLFYDGFRPTSFETGFSSVDHLLSARSRHLAAVRRVFTESDVVVFTLGLTEAWRERMSGAVFPVAPGVAAGSFDARNHEFINFKVAEVVSDLGLWCDRLRLLNPRVRIILTVSPVPLAATAENENVWVATTLSKSILRVAAAETISTRPNVDYFPSYEIITAPSVRGRYYEDDARSINRIGVAHVMRVFDNAYLSNKSNQTIPSSMLSGQLEAHTQFASILCDEDLIENALGSAKEFDSGDN